jgi:DHA2 family multidrug resistance protein
VSGDAAASAALAGQPAAGPSDARRARRARLILIASTMLATMLFPVDTTIANIALPHMLGSLQATPSQGAWVLTSYIVAAAVGTPLVGFFATRLGVRPVLATCIAGFTLASCLCGTAMTLEQMVLYRALQGLFGGGLIPLSQIALLTAFPAGQAARATSIWGMGVLLGPILGPPLGGYLTEYQGWRWVFYVNVPVGLLALAGTLFAADATTRDLARRFDALGYVLLALTLALLQLFLDRGNDFGWLDSPQIVATAIASGLLCYMFVVHSLTSHEPFLRPALFRDRNFVLCTLMMCLIALVMYAGISLQIPFTQQLQGYSVVEGGLLGAPRGIGMMIGMTAAAPLLTRLDARVVMGMGAAAASYSFFELRGFTLDVSALRISLVGVVQGLGLGLYFVPMGALAYATLPLPLRAEAGALFSVIRNLGGSVGIALGFAQLSRSTDMSHAALVERLDTFEAARWSALAGASGVPDLARIDIELQRQAAVIAYSNVYTAALLLVLATTPLVLLIRAPRQPPEEPAPAR